MAVFSSSERVHTRYLCDPGSHIRWFHWWLQAWSTLKEFWSIRDSFWGSSYRCQETSKERPSQTLFSVTGNHFRFCYRSRWLPARELFYSSSLGLALILIIGVEFGVMLLTQGSVLWVGGVLLAFTMVSKGGITLGKVWMEVLKGGILLLKMTVRHTLRAWKLMRGTLRGYMRGMLWIFRIQGVNRRV